MYVLLLALEVSLTRIRFPYLHSRLGMTMNLVRVLSQLIELVFVQLTFATRRYSYQVNAVLFEEVAKGPAHGVHVGILLYAAGHRRKVRLDELARTVLDGRVAQGLVEALGEIGAAEQIEQQSLRVDAYSTWCQLCDGGAAV